MSANKYSNLPDIDTAQDVYETEDTLNDTRQGGDASDAENALPTRPSVHGLRGKMDGKEELDMSSLNADEAGKKFRKAEKRRDHRQRSIYTYPPSPTSPTSPGQPRSLSTRLRALQAELSSLESELEDPSNPLLNDDHDDNRIDPGELMRGLVDVRGRLEKVRKNKEGRGRLVEVVLEERKPQVAGDAKPTVVTESVERKVDVDISVMDKRVGELEALVGSSSTILDESSPLPAPLLPTLSKLNTQLTLLTQPRHLDSISRRLKLLLSDLERLSSSQHQQTSHRRQSSQTGAPNAPSPLQEQLAPILARLAPNLPHIPHILTRLRTLSALHTSAAEFQSTLEILEEEQVRVRAALEELTRAVDGVDKSLDDNGQVVKGNIAGLEGRVESLVKRLAELSR
ncbi:hypothetical protein BD410DRAFT_745489 [Rickenella mellea]|uniref:Dynamitin-domain-containing protein n=1 Tax=Rickenella mellea TaxID=50990 RepID=A0A4Y7Q940_9AGAM|nr:hypothetical protein BD410DRAFT_745489 [Rickenella mellea]